MNPAIQKTVAALSAFALSLTLAAPALAQTNAYGNAGVDAVVNSDLGASVKNVVNAIVDVEGSATTSAGAKAGATGTGAGASGNTEVNANANVNVNLPIVIVTRADVESGEAEATSATIATVQTEADLTGYVAAQIQSDENLAEVESSAQNVSVTYSQNARLFGFIPITLDAVVTVDAAGNVEVDYPWYAFLAVTNETELETDLQGTIDSTFALGADAEANAGLGANTQARLINEIKTTLAAELDASIDASANASGNANVN